MPTNTQPTPAKKTEMTAKQYLELVKKATPGEWRIGSDAQGPFIVMHPTLQGVAIAACGNAFKPVEGFHSPTVDTPEVCEDSLSGTTYRPERVANVRLIQAAHNDVPAILEANQATIAALVAALTKAGKALEVTADFIAGNNSSHAEDCNVASDNDEPCNCYVSVVPDAGRVVAKVLRLARGEK